MHISVSYPHESTDQRPCSPWARHVRHRDLLHCLPAISAGTRASSRSDCCTSDVSGADALRNEKIKVDMGACWRFFPTLKDLGRFTIVPNSHLNALNCRMETHIPAILKVTGPRRRISWHVLVERLVSRRWKPCCLTKAS